MESSKIIFSHQKKFHNCFKFLIKKVCCKISYSYKLLQLKRLTWAFISPLSWIIIWVILNLKLKILIIWACFALNNYIKQMNSGDIDILKKLEQEKILMFETITIHRRNHICYKTPIKNTTLVLVYHFCNVVYLLNLTFKIG